MTQPSELDLAELRHEMREMYKGIGTSGALQVVYEMLLGATILLEVIAEEQCKKGA